jgi:VanZ family protein
MNRTTVRALAPLALMGVIFYLSGQEQVGPELPAFTRVVAHFTEYAVLAALWIWALVPELGRRRGLIAAVAISVLYAAGDEWHQSFVEGRDSDPVDFLIDCCGIAFAAVVSVRSGPRAASRRRPTSP